MTPDDLAPIVPVEYWVIGEGPIPRDDYIHRLIAKGWTDPEILETFEQLLHESHSRRMMVDHIAAIRAAAAPIRRHRARLVPDVEAAMRKAIATLTGRDQRLTWGAVAQEIFPGLSSSTLRTWASDDKLPHPSDPSWRLPRA